MMIGQLDWEKIDLIRLINNWRLCNLRYVSSGNFLLNQLVLKSGMVMGDSSVWILQVLGDVINFCSNFSSTV